MNDAGDRGARLGRARTVGIRGDSVRPVGEIIPKHEIYDDEYRHTPGLVVEGYPALRPPV